MKNYLNQLVTELTLEVNVDGTVFSAGLHEKLNFKTNQRVSIDGIEILPKFDYLAENHQLTIDEPFYCWYHRASEQGWLLTPFKM